jgi:lactoylglutathione lyase
VPGVVTRLLVTHFDACLAFYRDALGLPVLWHQPGGTFASFRVGAGKLQLFDRHSMAEAVGTAALPAEAATQDRAAVVLEVDDVDALASRLRSHSAPFISEPHDRPDWSARVAHLRDPDGNLIELCQDATPTPEAVVRRYFDRLLNQRDLAVCDDLLAPDYVDHDAPPDAPPGPAGTKAFVAALLERHPDLTFRIDDLVAAGDRVALRATWQAAGYHETGLLLLRLDGTGRIAERWSAYRPA